MGYFKMITKSQTWQCPKTANYQIICVAGGCSAAYSSDGSNYIPPVAGKTTSFGNYVTADNGELATVYSSNENGVNGYTLNGRTYGTVNVRSNSVVSNNFWGVTAGTGYGGGGASFVNNMNGGNCGNIMIGECTINEGNHVACTVGEGGKTSEEGDWVMGNGKSGVIVIREV